MQHFDENYDFGPHQELTPKEIRTFKIWIIVTAALIFAAVMTIFILTR